MVEVVGPKTGEKIAGHLTLDQEAPTRDGGTPPLPTPSGSVTLRSGTREADEREVIAIEVARRMFPMRASSETSDVVLGWLRAKEHRWIKNTLAVADYILLREARTPK